MADFDYSIGGTDRKQEASEAISELQENRTLFIQKLTKEMPVAPNFKTGLTTPAEAFEFYKPSVDMEFENEDGSSVNETLHFTGLSDFGPKGIANQSRFIQEIANQEDTYLKVVKELKSNKSVQTVLQNKETKQAFLTAIAAMIKELEEAGA
jgi:predicted component of type VI protein secretion system